MADSKITALAALTTADPANDMFPVVDVSDTSMAASGTTKRISINNILACSPSATLASATITGDLTVATDAFKVISATKDVCIGTVTPTFNNKLTVVGGGGGDAFITSGNGTRTGYIGTDGTYVIMGGYSNHSVQIHANDIAQMRIAPLGVFEWFDGAGGTRMTLNSTGLGIGVSPSAKLHVNGEIKIADTYSLLMGTASEQKIFAGGAANNTYLTFSQWTGAAYTERVRIDLNGNLLVSKTSVSSATTGCELQTGTGGNAASVFTADASFASIMNRLTSDGTIIDFRRQTLSVGNIAVTTLATTYNSISDYRLKEAVQPLVGGLARVSALKPSIYKWKVNGSDGEGFLAHELAEVVPSAVTGEKDAVNEDGSIKAQGVDMSRIVPILVAAIQELTARVQTLEAK